MTLMVLNSFLIASFSFSSFKYVAASLSPASSFAFASWFLYSMLSDVASVLNALLLSWALSNFFFIVFKLDG